MKCPKCVDENEKSTIRPLGGSTTLLGYFPEYDEGGVYHDHDPNYTTYGYVCSRGHEWSEKHLRRCPAKGCNYGTS